MAEPADGGLTLRLPYFPYHPDPVGTGFVVSSDARCRACGAARGYVYTGPVFAAEALDKALCPWCIADGVAADKFGAEFTDVGFGVPRDVPASVTSEIARRTPGFSGWQQEQWLYHCGDGAAFVGVVGRKELEPHPDALEMLRHECEDNGWAPAEGDRYLAALDNERPPTAFLFRCRHCGRHLAYSDAT